MAEEEEVARLRVDGRGVVKNLSEIEKSLRQVFQLGTQLERKFATLLPKSGGLGELNRSLKSLSVLTRTLSNGSPQAQIDIARARGAANQVRGEFANETTSSVLQAEAEIKRLSKAQDAAQRQLLTQQRTIGLERIRGIQATEEAQVRLEAAERRRLLGLNRTEKSRREEEQRIVALRQRVEELTRADRERQRVIQREEGRQRRATSLQEELAFRQTNAGRQASVTAGQLAQQNRVSSVLGDSGASLLAVQARIMANFAVLSATTRSFSFLSRFVVDLDAQLKQLQAITASTNGEMSILRGRLIEVSEVTKFTALEVSEAATVLGQAGFSVREISQSIQPITLFATAVGTDLKTAVDLTTSALSVFNLQAEETSRVADIMTAAINNSKLTVDKLNLGLSFASNIAAQNNVEFSELVTVLASLANSGIRNGSTLGTGLRRLIIDLSNPTEKFRNNLRLVGLTTEDVNIRTQGLVTALRNLREAGFGVTEAMASFEVRSAAAFSAISNQLPSIDRLGASIRTVGAAAQANETQMEALANKWDRFTSVAGSFAANSTGPIVAALKGIVDGASLLLQQLNEVSGVLEILGPTLIGFGTAVAAISFGRLIKNLFRFVGVLRTVGVEAERTNGILGRMATRGGAGAFAARLLGMINPLGLSITLLTSLGSVLLSTANAQSEMNDRLDQAETQLNTAADKFNSLDDALRSVDDSIADLSRKSANLDKDQVALARTTADLGERFLNLGQFVGDAAENTAELIDRLRELRKFKLDDLLANIDEKVAAAQLVAQTNINRLGGEGFNNQALVDLIEGGGSTLGLRIRPTAPSGGVGAIGGAGAAREAAIVDAIRTGRFEIDGLDGLPDNIRDAVERALTSFRRTPDFVGRQLTTDDLPALEDFVSEQSRILAGLAQAETSASVDNPAALALLRALSENTLSRKQAGSAAANRLLDVTGDQSRRSDIEFQQTEFFDRADREIGEKLSELTVVRQRLEEEVNASDITALQAIENLESLEDEFRALSDKLKEEASTRGVSREFEATLGQRLAVVAGEVAVVVDETIGQIAEEATRSIGFARRARKRQIAEQASTFNERSTRSQIEAARQEINRLLTEELEDRRNELRVSLSSNDIHEREFELALAELNSEIEAERRTLNERANRAIAATRDAVQTSSKFFDDVARQLRRIDQEFRTRQREIERPLRENELRIDAATLAPNRNRISDVQVEALRREQEGLETQALEKEIESLTTKIQQLNKVVALTDESRTTSQRNVDRLESELSNGDTSAVQRDELEKELKQELEAISKAEDGLQQQTAKIQSLTQELEDKTLEFALRTEEQMALSIGQVLGAAIDQWTEEVGAFESLTKTIADNAKGFFTDVRNSISSATIDLVKGTKTISEAVRDMAATIVDSLLEIAAQRAATQLLGGGLGILGVRTGGLATDVGIKRFNSGGPVQGGIPNRDSVPAILQPGEFVVRKSAVDAVGQDFLFSLNSLSNSRVSGRTPERQPASNTREGTAVNVWVVSKDQVPPPSPRDIIAVVDENIATGGVIRKRIKSVRV